jgi:protein-tyrosine phosphatase
MSKINVLMVCLGNICRSPMAEAVFRHHLQSAGLAEVIGVDSAGTASYHVGETAHPRTLAVLAARNIPYDGRARQVVPQDVQRFHYILAMDKGNLRAVQGLATSSNGGAQIALFLSLAFAEGLADTEEVPDPYYTGEYERVYALVQVASQAWLKYIRTAHNL